MIAVTCNPSGKQVTDFLKKSVVRMEKNRNTENKRNDISRNFLYIFGIIMVLVYCGMACLLAFSPLFAERIAPGWRYTMGIVLFAYGIFRGYRQFKRKEY